MSSFFEEYRFALAKICKKSSLCSRRLLTSTFIFNKLWAKLYSQHSIPLLAQVIHEQNSYPNRIEVIILSTSFENTTCQVAWDMGQEHATMTLPFRIKLKKSCTKTVCVHLFSNAEVLMPSSKMTLCYSKIAAMWPGLSKITYTLIWQFF